MKFLIKYTTLLFVLSLSLSCFKDDDDSISSSSEIKDFVWKGMNFAYLYKENSSNLANDRFESNSEYQSYLNGFDSPESLFESVVYDRQTTDRFSRITTDYIALEQQFSGITKTNGAEFNFYYIPGSTSEIFGVVRLILPESNASNTSIFRGQVFNKIDDQIMTISNISSLLASETYSIGLAIYNDNGTNEIDDDTISNSSETIALSKSVYYENPIFKAEVFNLDNENVAYLMYNGFVADYDSQLNIAFGNLQSQNIQHLILDLRYNPGGSVNTAATLGSMITGFTSGVFAKLQYNNDLQNNNTNYNFSSNLSLGGSINSLNLNKVYVLTSGSSASASEMIINSLSAYIDVVQIGTKTVGKSQASTTIYDSPTFQRQGANSGHLYALQPLVAISVNKDDLVVPSTGLEPDIEISESIGNYGVLGTIQEPMLAAALLAIQNSGRFQTVTQGVSPVLDTNSFIPYIQDMYID
jgi:C-terminal processing protease CtpA/Prc